MLKLLIRSAEYSTIRLFRILPTVEKITLFLFGGFCGLPIALSAVSICPGSSEVKSKIYFHFCKNFRGMLKATFPPAFRNFIRISMRHQSGVKWFWQDDNSGLLLLCIRICWPWNHLDWLTATIVECLNCNLCIDGMQCLVNKSSFATI